MFFLFVIEVNTHVTFDLFEEIRKHLPKAESLLTS